MMTLELLQNYWWLLVSVLGGILVFLLFVQGGQTLLIGEKNELHRTMIVNSIGRKWELTFTTLVVFGGAAFASFPLFYSTSFGGAYWLWILILFSFVLQAVSYEYRSKPNNLLGKKFFDFCLQFSGIVGCILLGVAVAMFFFGAEFTVAKGNLLDNAAPVISQWAPTHGFEAIFNWRNLVLGITILFLARTLGCLYLMNNITDDAEFFVTLRAKTLSNAGVFVIFFLWFVALLLTVPGFTVTVSETGVETITLTEYKYLHNFISMWWVAATFLIGVVMALYGIFRSVFSQHFTHGIWWTGFGVFLVVVSLFWVAGYNDTSYYPSLIDAPSSLTIRNSSSSEFTLKCMSIVSLVIPFVLAYIWYVWRAMDKKKITPEEMKSDTHKY